MKRAFNILAILFTLFAFALCAFAKYDVITLWGGGEPVEITEPCKTLGYSVLWDSPDGDLEAERICTLVGTNGVPYVAYTTTNNVTEAGSLLYPGDRLSNSQQEDATGKLLIFIEK